MALAAPELVKKYFESENFTIYKDAEDVLRVAVALDNTRIDALMIFDDDFHVDIECFNFLEVPEEKLESLKLYKALNEANHTYKYAKFTVDRETKNIFASYYGVIQLDSCGEECFEMILRLCKIIEDAYPLFIKALKA